MIPRPFLLLFCSCLLLPAIARAEAPLAEKVPASSIVYVGWAGGEAFKDAADGTDVGALLEKTQVTELFTELLPRVVNRIGQASEGDFDAETAQELVGILQAVADKPTAVFFGGVTVNPDDGETIPKLGIIVEAGAEQAAALRQRVANIANASGNVIPLFLARAEGDDFLFYVGFTDLEIGMNLAGGGTGALADAPRFTETMSRLGDSARQFAVYVDGVRMLELFEQAVAGGDDETFKENWPTMRDVLGIGDIRAIGMTGAMEDGQWHSRRYVAAPMPRRGLLAINDPAEGAASGIDRDLLAAIPADANRVSIGKFDLGRFFDTVRELAVALDPEADTNIGQAMGFANVFVGANVERDVLRNFGPDWAVYQSPTVLPGAGGFVAVNKLKDPKRGKRALSMTSTAAVNAVRSQIDDPNFTLRGRSAEIDGVTVWYLGTPLVSPAWAVEDGMLFAGFYPQTVAAAVNAARTDGSVLDVDAFRQALDLAGDDARGLGYVNLPATAADAYTQVLPLVRLLDGGADLLKVEPVGPVLPTLTTVLEHITPSHGASWADEDGLYSHGVSPFPGANVVLQPQSAVAGVAGLQAGIILPALNRARETANRVKSANNLREIGLGLILYANDREDGKLPDDLASVFTTQDITAEVFVSPRTGKSLPGNWASMRPSEQAHWVNENSDYVYIGHGLDYTAPADVAIAFERIGSLQDGVNVLYSDGHVTFVPFEAARDALFETNRYRRSKGLELIEEDALR